MNPHIPVPRDRLASFCRAHGIARLALFGSALRSDFDPESDIDLLVDFAPGRTPGLLGLADMEMDLAAMLGRKVDLVPRGGIEESRNYIRRKAILDSAKTLYEA